ncbi:putative lrr receptor-like serine/threonine-protein kinase rkf3 [Quercus suber]|uniref:Lrr receptor-like serine/threonine-protein kinase rkf3 n=1 Tax=Quercus suber TaxID=58331 RepID=A0AAW0JK69_QUESU
MEMINGNNSVIKFTLEEIKKATKNFSRENLIGCGGYENVYKGILPDGFEVALKRFKNFSAAGDESFEHEVEIIASVRHVNLVALRGYCTTAVHLEGHQRIIIFGVVLLELLSGKKAVISVDSDGASLLTDWAWLLVREGRVLDVIDEEMHKLCLTELIEKYVLVTVLSSHPLLYARPSMDQIVKILETNFPVPSIPDRLVTLLAKSSQQALVKKPSYSHPFFYKSDHPILNLRDDLIFEFHLPLAYLVYIVVHYAFGVIIPHKYWDVKKALALGCSTVGSTCNSSKSCGGRNGSEIVGLLNSEEYAPLNSLLPCAQKSACLVYEPFYDYLNLVRSKPNKPCPKLSWTANLHQKSSKCPLEVVQPTLKKSSSA